MATILTLAGQDVSKFVAGWGSLQAVRKLKLSDSSLFSSRFSVTLDNTTGAFTPGGAVSMLPRMGWAGLTAEVSKDGRSLFDGFLWDLSVDDEASTVTLELASGMTKASDTVASLAGAGLNPAVSCLGLLVQAGLEDLVNKASFSVAAGLFRGYNVDIDCPASEGQSCLSLASQIADICSMDFILARGLVYCVVDRPWDGSGLRRQIDGSNARSFRPMGTDSAGLANQVAFSWGPGTVLTLDDKASQRAERRTVSTAVDATAAGSRVQVSDERTARFFASLLLARTSPRRELVEVVADPGFEDTLPGWLFPIDYANLGLAEAPFKVNEAQVSLDTDETTITLQSMEAPQ